jgi:hypothetical protein
MGESMTLESIVSYIREKIPKEDLDKSGAVLYSNYYTLTSGKLYILGFNPGGDPEEQKEDTIRKDIENRKKWDRNYSEYTEKWGKYKPGEDPLQKSIRFIVEDIFNLNITAVCASNLIFLRTRKQEDLYNWKMKAEEYWPIHKFIITEIVRPRVIISFGIDTYNFLKEKLTNHNGNERRIPAFWSNWKIRLIVNKTVFGRSLVLLGFPHFSRYKLRPFKNLESRFCAHSNIRERHVKEELIKALEQLI